MLDLRFLLQYWLVVELLGLAVFPLVGWLFGELPDRGWGFSKISGLLLVSYLSWLGGILKLVPFSGITLWVVFAVVALTSWGVFGLSGRQGEKSFLRGFIFFKNFPVRLVLLEEGIFILALAGWSYLRTFAPDIHGLEKYMDYGFMLSILRARYFPPHDHFLAGEAINYYYFGHLMAAVLTRLSRVPANFAYNLQMSLLFALTVLESFVLGYALCLNGWKVKRKKDLEVKSLAVQPIVVGLLAAFLVALAGNLHAAVYWPIKGRQYWYPDATRFIKNTIHEFPVYSFVVNDLHGHVSDLPVVLLIIGLLFTYSYSGLSLSDGIVEKRKNFLSRRKPVRLLPISPLSVFYLVPLALVIGITYATNAWDFMIYLVLSGLIFLLLQGLTRPLSVREFLLPVALRALFLLVLAVFFMLPYWLTVKPIGKGVGIVPLGGRSPLWQWLILWGHFVLFTLIWGGWLWRRFRKTRKLELKTENLVDLFVGVMMLWSLSLILLPEIIFIRDIYPTHYRANTMFKFGYQAFVMFGISLAYVIVRLWGQLESWQRYLFRWVSLVILFAVALYPLRAIDSGFNGFKPQVRRSLDGTAYLKRSYPYDALAIDWLNQNIQNQPIIVEAVGDSYTDYARVAANTGLLSVMGWPVHEWLWRGSYDQPMQPVTHIQRKTGKPDTVAGRVEDVRRFYETKSLREAKEIIAKYHIEYVYVGGLEQEKYPRLDEGKFKELGEVVYQNPGVRIYRIKANQLTLLNKGLLLGNFLLY